MDTQQPDSSWKPLGGTDASLTALAERLYQAAQRGVFEELGIKPPIGRLLGADWWNDSPENGHECQIDLDLLRRSLTTC